MNKITETERTLKWRKENTERHNGKTVFAIRIRIMCFFFCLTRKLIKGVGFEGKEAGSIFQG